MPIKTNLTKYDSSLPLIHTLHSDKLGVVTSNHEIYIYDTLTDTNEKIIRLNIRENGELIGTFSPDGHYFLFGTSQSQTLYMVDLEQKNIINRFELDQQSPTAIMFSNDSHYFVCGTTQGRVLLWKSDSTTLISRLHSFPEYTSLYVKPKINFVSAIAFNSKSVVTSGYGGTIVATEFRTQIHTKRFHPGNVKISTLLFYGDTIIAGNQSGSILKIDRSGKHPNKRLSTSLGTITHLLRISENDPYLIAIGTKNYATLINAETMQIIYERYIETDHIIASLSKDSNTILYAATTHGELVKFDILPLKKLEALTESKSFTQAYLLCEEEPLLKHSDSYQRLESYFQHAVQHAKALFQKGEFAEAKMKLQPFSAPKSKEITTLLTAFSNLKQLNYLFEHQKFSPFYGLIEQYPLLCSSHVYEQIEKLWSERFKKAQKLMFMNKKKEAQEELLLFSTVNNKRPLVLLLIQHLDVFKIYSKAIHDRDYMKLNQLIIRYPILRKLPSYNELIQEAGELITSITEAVKEKKFEYALLLLNELSMIPQYENEFTAVKQFVSKASNLHHAMSNNHLRSAYSLIDTHPELTILPWGHKLEILWQEKLERSEAYAAQGDASGIKKEFMNLINLRGRHERIGDLLRCAYHVQLSALLESNVEAFSRGIRWYCELFGIDTELRHLLHIAKRKQIIPQLDQTLLYPKKRDQWVLHITDLRSKIG